MKTTEAAASVASNVATALIMVIALSDVKIKHSVIHL